MHMKSLTVLDLPWTQIEWLPDSVSHLVNLRGLLLLYCDKLVRVPSLSKLRSLRVLKLTRSGIEELPRGMKILVNLRSLHLSRNHKLKEIIPTGLISKFSLLQELKLENLSRSTQLENLSSLTQLENLRLSDFAYGEFGNFERLKKYIILVEKMDRLLYEYINDYYIIGGMESSDHERSLCLSNSKGIPCNALSLPKRIQFLLLERFNQITRLSELPLNDSQQELRELWIDSCNSIKILLSSRLLQQLLNLQVILVVNCTQLEELIVEEEEAGRSSSNHSGTGIDYTVALPRLKSLIFHNLPKLKSIWKGVMVCDSLQTVVVCNCPELKRLPLFNREHQSAPPSLKQIKGSREWWDSLEWDYPCPEHLFQEFNY